MSMASEWVGKLQALIHDLHEGNENVTRIYINVTRSCDVFIFSDGSILKDHYIQRFSVAEGETAQSIAETLAEREDQNLFEDHNLFGSVVKK